jgi:hypothetical protein
MEAIYISEMSVHFHWTPLRHIPEDSPLGGTGFSIVQGRIHPWKAKLPLDLNGHHALKTHGGVEV